MMQNPTTQNDMVTKALNRNSTLIPKRLGDVVELINGDRGKNYPNDSEQLLDGYCLFLSTKNVLRGRFEFTDSRFITEERHNLLSGGTLKRGDIVLTIRGTLGNSAVYDDEIPFSVVRINSAMIIVRPKPGVDPYFIMWALRSPAFMGLAAESARGSAQPHLRAADIREMPIPLPPLDEQRRIVAKLDALFAHTQRARAELARVPKLIERARQAVLAKAFAGELTQEWRTDALKAVIPSRSDIASKRKAQFFAHEASKARYVEPESIPFATPFDLPDSWLWFRAEAICDFITKGTTPSSSAMTAGIGEIPYIKVYNLTFDGSLDFEKDPTFISTETHEKELQRSKVFPSDVLMNIVGPPLGKVSLIPDLWPEWNINQAIAIFRPVTTLQPRFLTYWLLSEQVLLWAVALSKATAGQHNLTLQICRDLPVPLCSIEEQTEIVRRIEAAFARIERMAAEAHRAAALLDRLEQSTLAKAFRGELVGNSEVAAIDAALAGVRNGEAATEGAPAQLGMDLT